MGLASAWSCASARPCAASAAACIAFVRSARNLLGFLARWRRGRRRGRDRGSGRPSETAPSVSSAVGLRSPRRPLLRRPRSASGGVGRDCRARRGIGRASLASRVGHGRRYRPASAVRSWERSELHGSRNPLRASVVAMGACLSRLDGWGVQGRGSIGSWRVGVMESLVVTQRRQCRWYRRRCARRCRACVRTSGAHDAADGLVSVPDRRPTSTARPGRARPPRPAAARPPDLGHGPLQLPLHVLHAEGGLRPRLRVPAARRGPELRGDRAAGAGLRRARRREAADHRRRAARPARPAGPRRDARRAPDAGRRAARPDADDERLRPAGRSPRPLADAGLRRVTVTLDSLDDATSGDERRRLPGRARSSTGSPPRARPASGRSRSTWSSGAG